MVEILLNKSIKPLPLDSLSHVVDIKPIPLAHGGNHSFLVEGFVATKKSLFGYANFAFVFIIWDQASFHFQSLTLDICCALYRCTCIFTSVWV